MIRNLEQGVYRLIESKNNIKILKLEKKVFAWINATGIGEILVSSHKPHRADSLLATGAYRIYEVSDEPKLTDLIHLELIVGHGIWQGYLLPTGLPNGKKSRSRIIPTKEIITKSL